MRAACVIRRGASRPSSSCWPSRWRPGRRRPRRPRRAVDGRRRPAGAQSQPGDAGAAARRSTRRRPTRSRPASSRTRACRSASTGSRRSRRDRSTGTFWATPSATAARSATLFERGGKRQNRDHGRRRHHGGDPQDRARRGATAAIPDGSRRSSTCSSRSRRWSWRRQNLKSFSDVVDVNRQRVTAGDLAESEFYKISLQKLQFEQDVSSAEVALVQAKATLRQLVGFDSRAGRLRRQRRPGVHGLRAQSRGSEAPGARRAPDLQARAERREARTGHRSRSRRATGRAT